MPTNYRLVGISGSIRAASYSTAILLALAKATEHEANFDYADIGKLPHFNQDLYVNPLPDGVEYFRRQIESADALVISSPEYNHGIPGVLKNALDWASRPHNHSPLKYKPVLIISSSPAFTGGVRAHYQIREALVSALARPASTDEIVVGNVAEKMIDGRFSDAATVSFAKKGLDRMFKEIDIFFNR